MHPPFSQGVPPPHSFLLFVVRVRACYEERYYCVCGRKREGAVRLAPIAIFKEVTVVVRRDRHEKPQFSTPRMRRSGGSCSFIRPGLCFKLNAPPGSLEP